MKKKLLLFVLIITGSASCTQESDLDKICRLLTEYEKAKKEGDKGETKRLENEVEMAYDDMVKKTGREKAREMEPEISKCENEAYESVNGPK